MKNEKLKAKRRAPRKLYAIIMPKTHAPGTTFSPWEAQMAAQIPTRVAQGAIIVDYRKFNRICRAGKHKSYYEVAKLAAVDIEAEIKRVEAMTAEESAS